MIREGCHVQEAWTTVDSESQQPFDDREQRVDWEEILVAEGS